MGFNAGLPVHPHPAETRSCGTRTAGRNPSQPQLWRIMKTDDTDFDALGASPTEAKRLRKLLAECCGQTQD